MTNVTDVNARYKQTHTISAAKAEEKDPSERARAMPTEPLKIKKKRYLGKSQKFDIFLLFL